jgi:hypothetical protein
MTLDVHAAGIPASRSHPEQPADPRPAWERVAYAWLAREVDAGQPVDPTALAREVSVAPDLARDLLRVLRAQRMRDPGLGELRARLVRDRITDAYLRRELAGDSTLIPPSWRPRSAPPRPSPDNGSPRYATRSGMVGCWSSPQATATPRPSSLRGCRPISLPAATSRPRSPAAPPTPSGWPPRSNATTGPGRSAAASGCSRGSSRGSWAATPGRSASSSPSCAPAPRPSVIALRSCGTPSSRTPRAGR